MNDNDIMLGELRQGQADIHRRLSDIEKTLEQLSETFATARGGFKTLVAVGGAAATVAAGIGEFLHWVHK